MPRNYKRKTEKCKWTVEVLQRAIEATENGLSLQKAGRLYGIPASTLRDRKKVRNYLTPKLGNNPVFNNEQEKSLAKQLSSLSKVFHRLTTITIRLVAFEFAEINNIPNRFNSGKKIAGKDWVDSFLRRNPHIRNFLDERDSVSEHIITDHKRFVRNLLKAMNKYKFTGNRIFSVDDVQAFHKKIQEENRVPVLSGNGNNVTVVCAANASGYIIPPMIIYPKSPKEGMAENVPRNGPVEASYKYSKSGFLTEDIFLDWLKFFSKQVNPTVDDPVLLVLHNQRSRISLNIYNYCQYNNVILVSAPIHDSQQMPLQITLVGSLQEAFARESVMFLKTNPNKKITYSNFASIFSTAYLEVATPESIISGFHQSGIFPLDTEKFKVDETLDDFSTDDDDDNVPMKEEYLFQEELLIDIKSEILDEQLVKEEFDVDTSIYEGITFTPTVVGSQESAGMISNQLTLSNIKCSTEDIKPGIRVCQLGSIYETTQPLNTSGDTTKDAEYTKRKLQQEELLDSPSSRIKQSRINETDFKCFSEVNVCDEELKSKQYFTTCPPSQLPDKHLSTSLGQDPADSYFTSAGNLAHRYTNLLNNPLMGDLSIDKDQLKTLLDQLDAAFSQYFPSQNSEVHQTEKCNQGTNMELFFNNILKIVDSLSPRDQIILQKNVADMVLDMKIRQLQS